LRGVDRDPAVANRRFDTLEVVDHFFRFFDAARPRYHFQNPLHGLCDRAFFSF